MAKLMSAVNFMHFQGVVHRDLKPEVSTILVNCACALGDLLFLLLISCGSGCMHLGDIGLDVSKQKKKGNYLYSPRICSIFLHVVGTTVQLDNLCKRCLRSCLYESREEELEENQIDEGWLLGVYKTK